MSRSFERAQKVADAVLYEGYVLYPYRASARKNRLRWQFGVLTPRAWSEGGGGEAWWAQTACLVRPGARARLVGRVRFLHVLSRRVEEARDGAFYAVETLDAGGALWTSFDEGIERAVDFELEIDPDGAEPVERCFAFEGRRSEEPIRGADGAAAGRVVRELRPLAGRIEISLPRLDAAQPLLQLRIRVANATAGVPADGPRERALGHFMVGTHTLLALDGAEFVSLLDPPDWAAAAAADCPNVGTWPVMAGPEGDRRLVLSSPILLPDHPAVAPESVGDLYDATEIDEILTLRTMTLTDEEKREARATDPRAAAIIDRVDALDGDDLARLHGAIRCFGRVADAPEPPEAEVPWWNPAPYASVSPSTDAVEIAGAKVARGSRVRLRPGPRRADAQDMFFEGRIGLVEGVFLDVDDRPYLAVTVEDDPAAELQRWHGRYLYFATDEVEPLEAAAPDAPPPPRAAPHEAAR